MGDDSVIRPQMEDEIIGVGDVPRRRRPTEDRKRRQTRGIGPRRRADLNIYDGGLAVVSSEKVDELNRLQVEQNHRHVFSSTGDFTTALRVCEENPAVCDPARQTIEITVTQTGPMTTRFEARVRS